MGRTDRNRKRKKANDLEIQQSTNGRLESMNSEDIYINLARSLYRNGWLNETNLKVGDFPVTGRGIYSIKNLHKDDLLISLPIESLISIVSIADDMKFRYLMSRTFGTHEKQITSQGLLALYLLYLKHTGQHTEYMSTLPTAFSVPYFCADAEINAMLPSIRDKVLDQREIIDVDFSCFQSYFKDTRCTCCNRIYFCDIFNRTEFEWSFFAVNSRSVYFNLEKIAVKHLESVRTVQKLLKDEPTLALAPFLDLLNHSCTASTGLYVKNTDNGPLYQLYTTVPFSKYEQVFISYGALDNTKLLTEYGFFVPNNKHDFVEIQRKDIDIHLKMVPYRIKILISNESLDQNLFITRANGFSHNIRILIYICCNATHATTATDENYCKKIIYGDINELDFTSMDMKKLAQQIVDSKVKELRDQCGIFTERQTNHTLTERATIYLNYLQEAIKWLECVEL
ncbi:SET domain-containing protein 4 [Sitodiplosis mosellana]|uniref:SET domain-containing protein 4 n=1 Tax=Sitodiplosis mosellana TaxID=263140 RepID=UPI0024452FE6|nr:SET domain-containing protein 4 [Sitodiplosis mosellana]